MALPKGLRGRTSPPNGASSGARGGSVKDARDVIRGREQRPPNRGAGPSPRILKTAHGFVTNRKAKGISTSQLKNRQSFQPKSATLASGGRPPASKMAVGAAIRKSAVINSNPMLQNAILDIAGALAQQRRPTIQPVKKPQFKPARPAGFRSVRNIDRMDVEVDRLDRGNPLVSNLSYSFADYHRGAPRTFAPERGTLSEHMRGMSLADIPRAAPRAFAPERASLSDRMRGRLDQRHDPPCSVLVSNLHPNVSDSDINELFRTIGPIVTSMFLSPGTALVSYHRKNDAVKAVETYHLRLLDGQPMTCVLLSQDMVPDKQQPSIPGSSVATVSATPGRR